MRKRKNTIESLQALRAVSMLGIVLTHSGVANLGALGVLFTEPPLCFGW